MYLLQQPSLQNLNPMDASPQRKKARFSQHPQVFEYSSKSKRDGSVDNDSMLLDLNEEEARQIRPVIQNNSAQQNNQFMDRQIQIDQLTSDLAQIQAYLNQQSRPISPIAAIHSSIKQPKLPSNSNIVSNSNPNISQNVQNIQNIYAATPNKTSSHDRFTFNIKPQLINTTGRQTMNLEQEIRVRSTIKEMDDQVSNNKKRERVIKEKQKQKEKQIKQKEDNKDNKQSTTEKVLQKKIQDQIKKNKRITLDTKELLNLISYQSDFEQEQRRVRDQRKNRITMDVFALSKFLQTAQQDNMEQQNNANQNLTPIKTNIQKSTRKTNIFSAFKQRPQEAQIKLFVNSYLNDAPKRLNDKKNENKILQDMIAAQKSQLLKLDLKISDSKKRVERFASEKSALLQKLKGNGQQLDKKKYLDDIEAIKEIQNKMMIKVLKLDMEDLRKQQSQADKGCYGHFMWDGIFVKAKSKGFTQPIQLKIMMQKKARENSKNFAISTQQALKLLKKYHSKYHSNPQNPIPFLTCISYLRSAYNRLIQLDNDLYYLSLSFNLRDFQINPGTDILSFNLCTGSDDRPLLIQLNTMQYMLDQNGNDWSAIAVYDAKKAGYYDFSNKIRDKSKQKQKQNKDINTNKERTSIVFEAVFAVLQMGGIV